MGEPGPRGYVLCVGGSEGGQPVLFLAGTGDAQPRLEMGW